jgi:hypothetical protein
MTALPHLTQAEGMVGCMPTGLGNSQDCDDIATFEDFQAAACSAFEKTLMAAKEVQKEFCSFVVQLNSSAKRPFSGINREKLLQRLISETASPYTGTRLFHISLGQQFSRIFLKRRKVQ